VELAPEWPNRIKIKNKNKNAPNYPNSSRETTPNTDIGASFSIQNLVHWKTILSTAVLGRSPVYNYNAISVVFVVRCMAFWLWLAWLGRFPPPFWACRYLHHTTILLGILQGERNLSPPNRGRASRHTCYDETRKALKALSLCCLGRARCPALQ